MNEYVILPPEKKVTRGLPIIYLAGPTEGIPNWHRSATHLLQNSGYRGWIVSPRPTTIDDEAQVPPYAEQLDWEHHFIQKTLTKNGVMLFWLAKEVGHDHLCARTQKTRFEIGWVFHHAMQKVTTRIVIGIEEGFSGARHIRMTFGKFAPHVHFHDSLKETCAAAVELI